MKLYIFPYSLRAGCLRHVKMERTASYNKCNGHSSNSINSSRRLVVAATINSLFDFSLSRYMKCL